MWYKIPGQPNYEASDSGFIRRKDTKYVLKGTLVNGYRMVNLSHSGISKAHMVHSLVKRACHGSPQVVVHHKDGNKLNNHISNLEYEINAHHVSKHTSKGGAKCQ